MLRNRTTYKVTYEDGYWKIVKGGLMSPTIRKYSKKSTASKKAREMAKINKPSIVKVEDKRGKVIASSKYRKSREFPPRG